ncbi:alpha/beta hydrolase [Pleurocapsales cyanobacterium LEGE 06147]|nr:alpha/beta hydrolase [Pleurocapsales cyanobacterium LEGE 06147]
MNQTSEYIYLHGFASSPQSHKAQYLRDRFSQWGLNLNILDLNGGDFSHLTLTRQIKQTQAAFPPAHIPVTLVGSSFGGLTAAWLAEKCPQVQRLILLAPAFGFLKHWLPRLGRAQVKQWQSGYLSVYHYAYQRQVPLHYNFVTDLSQYRDEQLRRSLPTLILHGKNDEVIPIDASRNYARLRPWVELIELDSEHALIDVLDIIGQAIEGFL